MPSARRPEDRQAPTLTLKYDAGGWADFATVGLMTTRPEMCGPAFQQLMPSLSAGHALPSRPRPRQDRGFKLPQRRHGNVCIRSVSALGRPFVGPWPTLRGAPADLESSLTEFRVFLPTVVSAVIPQASQRCHGPPRTVTVRSGIHATSCNRHQIERPRLAPASASLSIAGAPSAVV
jgi:hypothetical protein